MNALKLLGRPIAFQRIFVEWTGSVNAALMLSQMVESLSDQPRDLLFKTAAQWEEETGLTLREQMTARKILREKGLVEEERVGMPARLSFRILPKLEEMTMSYLTGKSPQK